MDNTILRTQTVGQSTWIDYIRRSMLTTGELGELVRQGVTGLTSNPTIFEKAIAGSTDYDRVLTELMEAGKSPAETFESLAAEDIQGAADILRSVYDHTAGVDGLVSLELPPPLADDTQATVREARRLFGLLRRPNVMIKVPATAAGIAAIPTLIEEGINVNATLIFSLDAYRNVMDAYLTGLESAVKQGRSPSRIASVASFFVSRVDTVVDGLLRTRAEAGEEGLAELTGTAAVANAQMAYALFQEAFGGERFAKLSAARARVQRPLWASTSTKDPALPDTYYVDTLIGPDTVNTMPPNTLEAVLDHGASADSLAGTKSAAESALEALSAAGIDMDEVTAKLLHDGVASFASSYNDVLTSIEAKCSELAGRE